MGEPRGGSSHTATACNPSAFAIVARNRPELRLEIVGDNRSHPHEDLPAIAAGAGVSVQEVNRLLAQFEQMQKMMRQMQKGGLQKMMRAMKGMKIGRAHV